MKKSELFKEAQMAIMRDELLSNAVKLDIIRELQDKESTALFVEQREEAQAKETEENAEN